MASACVNNIAMSPENFLDCPTTYPSYGWLNPRMSLSGEIADDEPSKVTGVKPPSPAEKPADESDLEVLGKDFGDFEFRLEDPVTMLPADELFFDGKLVPLQLSMIRSAVTSVSLPEIRSPDTPKSRRISEILGTDPNLFSPKAPRCSSRWKELLGFSKLYQNNNSKQDSHKMTSTAPSHNSNSTKSLKHFLHRCSKSSSSSTLDSSLSLPLLKDSDNESISISSRLSLSSSSSGHDHDDLMEKPCLTQTPTFLAGNPNQNSNQPKVRAVKVRADNPTATKVGRSTLRRPPDTSTTTADSPRMNSSGKIVFQSLERSSSSPSSFNSGPRFKHRGMERSYSANVRVTPVLNVPVCSLRGSFGFPLFSSQQKKEGNGGSKSQHSKNRTDRV